MNEKNNGQVEIDLLELFGYMLQKIWIILASAVVAAAAAFIISRFFVTPLYQSVTKVYILSRQNESALTYSDVQLGTQLTKDYAGMIKSRTVLESVITDMGLYMTYEQLGEKVSVETSSDTRILGIRVTDENPVRAKMVADAIRISAAEHIKNVMDVEAVNVVDEANLPENPASPNVSKWTAMGGMIGAVAAIGILTVIFMLDDTIKTSDDIERYLNISTLATIPVFEDVDTEKRDWKDRKDKNEKKDRMAERVEKDAKRSTHRK